MSGRFAGMRFETSGTAGPWVVCSHALGADRSSFRSLSDSLVRAGHRVLVWDLPGHGESADGPVGLEALTGLLPALIAHVAGDGETTVLIGHSYGGYLSQLVAL
jgi:pimeloyl-ACP methyl ester carboxylesterase